MSDRKKPNPKKRYTIKYSKEDTSLFEGLLRPRVNFALYSRVLSQWINIEEVLADTGADISLLPRSLGVLLVGDIRQGKKYRMTGLVKRAARYFYLHRIKMNLGGRKIDTVFAVAANDDVPPTLGRVTALDRFNVEYQKGRQLTISW